jgi:aromatic-L-amino-acid/L-tryptophan decarboxylase
VKPDEFAEWSQRAAKWGAEYRRRIGELPVRAATMPGEIASALPDSPPERAEAMDIIFRDFEDIIVPGMTHWQHPRFFAYFPANAAPASVVAEYLVAAMAAQCMLWQTSPAATELETKVLDWLRRALGLPAGFSGVIQDSASSATLAAVLTMRERALGWQGNKQGLAGQKPVRIYCSQEVHTSIDRAAWFAGIGAENLVKLPVVGPTRGADADALAAAIVRDLESGYLPAGIVASVGGTSVGGSDDVAALAGIARRHNLYLHVDAAWAGSAMICPEFRGLWHGVELADSIVVNPHKWLGAQFDCTAQFLANPADQIRTLAITPSFLETHGKEGIVNYSEWSIPLGRRFRALKLWFLLRAYGLEALRQMIRSHIEWSREMRDHLAAEPGFEITSEPVLSLFSFRYVGNGDSDKDAVNQRLVDAINDDGRIYVTQTRLDGKLVIRFQIGQFDCGKSDLDVAFATICELARSL